MKLRTVGPVFVAFALAIWALARQQEPFPHRLHGRLFPLCEGCHAGTVTGSQAEVYPAPDRCAGCHDGQREARVAWSGPRPRASNLVYSHVQHARAVQVAGDSLDCGGCHGQRDGGRMAVGPPDAGSCLRCHAHQAPDHLSEARDCAVCHQRLTNTALSAEQVAQFPVPPRHRTAQFLLDHRPRSNAEQNACATCHARNSCTRCHMDASVPAIAALDEDPRVAAVTSAKRPSYPEPPGHQSATWSWSHGSEATAAAGSCANCHERTSCTACHRDTAPPEVLAVPRLSPADARGVRAPADPPRVHRGGYAKAHAPDAATADASCSACHAMAFCENCHDAAAAPAFHASNFLARHGPEAYANETDCASCHNRELFCRACHQGIGLGAQGRLGVAFHTANPFWIVGHGVAARQGLEGCASCHAQTDCTQCHSTLGGWRANPHGPRLDLDRLESANPLLCRRCHRTTSVR